MSFQIDDFVGFGVGEGEAGGVEEVAVEFEVGFERGVGFGGGGEEGDSVRGSVEVVADDGVAEGLHVDADLMGAAGLDADLDEGEGAVGGGETLEDVDVGDGGADAFAAEGSAGGHAGATDEVAGDGEVDGDVGLPEGGATWPWTRAR